MTIAVGAHDHKQGTTASTTLTTNGVTTQATGSTFLIAVVAAGTSNITAVADNKTNAYTQIGTTFNTSFGSCMAWFRKENGLGGVGHTITSTLGTGQVQTIYFVEITGAATSSVLDQSVAFAADASSPFTTTATGTTTQANEIAIAFYGTDTPSGTETITWGGGFTQIDADGNSNFVTGGIGFKVLSATGTVQGSITSSVATDTAGAVVTFKAAAGTNSYTYLPTGGLTFAGSAVTLKGKVYPVGGGLSFLGVAPVSKGKNYPAGTAGIVFGGAATTLFTSGALNAYVYLPTGGIVFGGLAILAKGKVYPVSGGIVLGGTATTVKQKNYLPSGGLLLGGSAILAKGKIYLTSGGVLFGGGGIYQFSGTVTPVVIHTINQPVNLGTLLNRS